MTCVRSHMGGCIKFLLIKKLLKCFSRAYELNRKSKTTPFMAFLNLIPKLIEISF